MKTGGRLVKHARYYWLLLAEGHLNRRLWRHAAERICRDQSFETGMLAGDENLIGLMAVKGLAFGQVGHFRVHHGSAR